MEIEVRGRDRRDGNRLYYKKELAEIYHSAKHRLLVGWIGGHHGDIDYNGVVDLELFTGFYDKSGEPIWEHDYVTIMTVVWDSEKGMWALEDDKELIALYPVVGDLTVNDG